jgi:hypothetical protein
MTLADLIDEVVSEMQADTAGATYPWEELVNSALQDAELTTRPARIAQADLRFPLSLCTSTGRPFSVVSL